MFRALNYFHKDTDWANLMDALGNIDWEANFKDMPSEEKLDFIYFKCHRESVSYVPEKTLAKEI